MQRFMTKDMPNRLPLRWDDPAYGESEGLHALPTQQIFGAVGQAPAALLLLLLQTVPPSAEEPWVEFQRGDHWTMGARTGNGVASLIQTLWGAPPEAVAGLIPEDIDAPSADVRTLRESQRALGMEARRQMSGAQQERRQLQRTLEEIQREAARGAEQRIKQLKSRPTLKELEDKIQLLKQQKAEGEAAHEDILAVLRGKEEELRRADGDHRAAVMKHNAVMNRVEKLEENLARCKERTREVHRATEQALEKEAAILRMEQEMADDEVFALLAAAHARLDAARVAEREAIDRYEYWKEAQDAKRLEAARVEATALNMETRTSNLEMLMKKMDW